MDLVTINAAITAAKAAAQGLRALTELKLDTKALTQVNDAQQAVANLQQHLFLINEQLFRLQAERDDLVHQIQAHERWETEKADYRLVNTTGGAAIYESLKQDPKHFACPSCYTKKTIVPLQTTSGHYYNCPSCKESYCVKTPPDPRVVVSSSRDTKPW